jgi:hypothetical protein
VLGFAGGGVFCAALFTGFSALALLVAFAVDSVTCFCVDLLPSELLTF